MLRYHGCFFCINALSPESQQNERTHFSVAKSNALRPSDTKWIGSLSKVFCNHCHICMCLYMITSRRILVLYLL